MILIDSHSHSKFSFDSSAEPEDMICAAIDRGIETLCFTEHLDIDVSNVGCDFSLRFRNYFKELTKLRTRYGSKIDIIIGLEAGYGDYYSAVKSVIDEYPFEYIISSVHVHGDLDYYQHESYAQKDKKVVYDEYLELVYNSLLAPYSIDAVGHLGYPSRFASYENSEFCFEAHRPLFEKIFDKMIEKEVILEVNTNIYRSPHNTLASTEMLKNYFASGGRLVTFSSDSHSPHTLAKGYDSVINTLKSIGFTYLTKSKNKQRTFLKI